MKSNNVPEKFKKIQAEIRNKKIEWSYCRKHEKPFIILCMKCFLEAERGR